MRLVLDTNVIISALIWGGIPQELVELAFRSQVELITSRAMLDELANVLSRGKFANELPLRGVIPVRAVDRFASGATIVIPQPAAGFVPRDPDDDAVLGTALAGRADLIATGDRDLLSLHPYSGIHILGAADALQRVRTVLEAKAAN